MDFLKQTFSEFLRNRCTTLAAALAFYTVFALPPMLYLLLTVLTFGMAVAYDSDDAKERAQTVLEEQAAELLGNKAAAEGIVTILENNRKGGGVWWKSLLSFAGIIVAATGVVVALQDSLNRVWQVMPDPETSSVHAFLRKRVLSFAMIIGLGFLLLISLVVSSVLSTAGRQLSNFIGMSGTIASTIDYAVQVGVVFVVFAAIFKFMPDVKVDWRDVFVGAAITTVLFAAGRYAMLIYFSYSAPGAQLGAAAVSLAVILMWVYYTSIVVLVGAEATQVFAIQYGNGIRPQKYAVRVVEDIRRQEADDKEQGHSDVSI